MTLIVNGETIDDSIIRAEANALRPQYEAMVEGLDPVAAEIQLRDWSRENVIERVLLRQEALNDPEPLPPDEIEKALQEIKSQTAGQPGCNTLAADDILKRDVETRLRLDRLIRKVTGKVSPPKNKDIGDYYRKNQERFWAPEMVHAAHIVKNVDDNTDENTALEAIRKAQEELNNGGGFEELADHHSDCPGAGGDLGYFPRGQMVEEFENVAFSMEANQVSNIVRSPFGFHLIKVYERKPAGVRSLADVRGEIERIIFREKQERAMEVFVDRLKAKADIRDDRRKSGSGETSPATAS
ncbi:MAG: peptidylprolyl isomerase [Bryobacteraceae bacterium]